MSSPHLPSDLTSAAAAVPLAIAAAIIVLGALLSPLAGRHLASELADHITLGLEFLLAAGLIRLASVQSFEMLGLVAAIIAARRVIVLGIRFGARAAEG
ncbi:MAG: DUF1622 domain-containing protein [Solirubrobacterales bacterium]